MTDFFDAVRLVESGLDPDVVADSLFHESAIRPIIATGAVLAAGSYLISGIRKASDEAAFKLATGHLISSAIAAAADSVARLYSWGAAKVFPEVNKDSIDKTTFKVNVVQTPDVIPQSVGTGRRGGAGSGKLTRLDIPNPDIGITQIAQIERQSVPGGEKLSVYRVDPVKGLTKGAPIKTFSVKYEGNSRKDIQRIQNGIERSLLTLARGIAKGRQLEPPSYVGVVARQRNAQRGKG